MRFHEVTAVALALSLTTGLWTTEARAAQESTEDERPYLLETSGDAAVVQLYADGFDSLSLQNKALVWHLSQAALAGRDIYYDQRYEHNLEMRDVLE